MCVSVYCPLECAVCLSVCLCVISSQSTSKKPQYVPSLSKLDAFLHKTHIKVLLVLRYQGSACVVPFLLLSKIAHQMWRNHPFSQTGQLCKETLKISHPLILTPAPPPPPPSPFPFLSWLSLISIKNFPFPSPLPPFLKNLRGGGIRTMIPKLKFTCSKPPIEIHWCWFIGSLIFIDVALVFLLLTLNIFHTFF